MPDASTSHVVGASAPGPAGRVGVDGTDGVSVRFHRRADRTEVELVAPDPASARPTIVRAIADAVRRLGEQSELAGSAIHLAADHPAATHDPLPEAVADALGLTEHRDLLQLRRPLPVPTDDPHRHALARVRTRAFRPGRDDDSWVRVNNRAFAHHPDQGRETVDTLAARTAEPWFDPRGFLVADDPGRPGELSGFCWTRVHPASHQDPALGEIYVIGVDPSHRGEGLGPGFVLAGLDHLAAVGLTTANLYVDDDNRSARRLYEDLGFTTHRRRRLYSAPRPEGS